MRCFSFVVWRLLIGDCCLLVVCGTFCNVACCRCCVLCAGWLLCWYLVLVACSWVVAVCCVSLFVVCCWLCDVCGLLLAARLCCSLVVVRWLFSV